MLLKIFFFAFILNYAYGCNTPNNQVGKCMKVKSCPKINAIFSSNERSHEENKFLAASICFPIIDKNNPDVCCELEISLANRFLPTPEECGKSDVDYKVDEPTFIPETIQEPDRYPWLALIEYETIAGSTIVVCGGTLISNRYILTAAHCVVGYLFEKDFVPKTVRLGVHRKGAIDCLKPENAEDCNRLPNRVAIEKIIPHSKYDRNDPYYRNNIALIKFARRIQFSSDVKPICLSNIDMSKEERTELILAGWGTGNGPTNSFKVKQHKKAKIVGFKKCNESLSINGGFVISDMQFCAGDDDIANCVANGGNGAMHFMDGKYYLAGIVSLGSHMCKNSAVPDIFTNVYQYKGWISEQVV